VLQKYNISCIEAILRRPKREIGDCAIDVNRCCRPQDQNEFSIYYIEFNICFINNKMPLETASLAITNCMLLSFLKVNSAFVSPIKHFHLIRPQSSSWANLSSTVAAKMNSNEKNVALEIEQKFALDNGGSVEKRLKELGLQEKGCVTMVDWYFDLPAPRWSLAPKDCWLRYREKEKKGTWELKRGGRHEEGGATLYEEIEGLNGFNMALSALPSTSSAEANVDELPTRFDGLTIPPLPVSCALVPFARIESRRSTWYFAKTKDDSSGPFHDLTVVIDITDFGHMVGEVEAVVYDEKDVPGARERIGKLIVEIAANGPSVLGVGKLEHYLMINEPDLYEIYVKQE